MFPRIRQVRHIKDYRVELTFSNGERAELDCKDMIVGRGGVFAALEDIALFSRVTVDPEAGTITWPGGVDFCPDVLYSRATGTPLPAAELERTKQ